ncbi:MAG: FkbM family methyltransferase [Verrucomicrobia bacterium]|nr:FkbM family methyltransferase [Verrucomicrobiota bacterium]
MAHFPVNSQNQPVGLSLLKARIRELFLHVQVLGFVRGLVTWLRVSVLRQQFEISVQVPALKAPVILRAGGSDIEVFKKIFIDHEYRLPFDACPCTILDLGANTGLASLYFRTQFPEAQIVAVEPDPANFAMMQRHLGALPGVEIIQAAVWSHDGEITLTDPGIGSWAMRVEESSHSAGSQCEVAALSMPSLLKHFPQGRVALLKMDVEGAEKEVFESSAAWIENIDAIVIELHDRYKPGCSRAFFTSVATLPCEQWIGENLFVWRVRA